MKPFPSPLQRLALPALAALALFSALPAQAVGRIADVHVIDRDSGKVLPVIRHRGEHWVAGRPGARYAVSVRNTLDARIMSVVSVDGVNVVSGDTASWEQTGYVLSPWQRYDITGWRKSDAEVAAFHFTAAPASYAARTGRAAQVGVIGVAVFREKAPEPVMIAPEPYSQAPLRERLGAAESAQAMNQDSSAAPGSAAPPPAPAEATTKAQQHDGALAREEAVASRRMAPALQAPRLGTGHGEREGSWVGHTTFERRSQQPDELIRIRYDSRENLIAMGVIPPDAMPHRPNPFPGSPTPRYAPDPN